MVNVTNMILISHLKNTWGRGAGRAPRSVDHYFQLHIGYKDVTLFSKV